MHKNLKDVQHWVALKRQWLNKKNGLTRTQNCVTGNHNITAQKIVSFDLQLQELRVYAYYWNQIHNTIPVIYNDDRELLQPRIYKDFTLHREWSQSRCKIVTLGTAAKCHISSDDRHGLLKANLKQVGNYLGTYKNHLKSVQLVH